jgi:predicted RNA-binding protein with PUA-like domain
MYWILKTEPGTYSFDDLKKDKTTIWDGVRNYQARNNLQKMERGELVMIYHSVSDKAIVGVAQVVATAFKDPMVPQENWLAVKVAYEKPFKTPISLAALKADSRLCNLSLIKQSRLSVCPVTKEEWFAILELAER